MSSSSSQKVQSASIRMDLTDYYRPLLAAYFKVPVAQQPDILKVIAARGDFPALVRYLSRTWFGIALPLSDSSAYLDFLIVYVLENRDAISFGPLKDLASLFTRILGENG
jgi:hypothetical protein